MPAGDEAVDGADAARGGDHELRPAFPGVDGAGFVGHGLERAHGGGTDGYDPAAGGPGGVDQAGGDCGYPVTLGLRRLSGFGGGHAAVEQQGSEHDSG